MTNYPIDTPIGDLQARVKLAKLRFNRELTDMGWYNGRIKKHLESLNDYSIHIKINNISKIQPNSSINKASFKGVKIINIWDSDWSEILIYNVPDINYMEEA